MRTSGTLNEETVARGIQQVRAIQAGSLDSHMYIVDLW